VTSLVYSRTLESCRPEDFHVVMVAWLLLSVGILIARQGVRCVFNCCVGSVRL